MTNKNEVGHTPTTVRSFGDVETGWLAAAIDSEGSIDVRIMKKGNHPQVSLFLCNTNRRFVEKAAEMMKSQVYSTPPRAGNRKEIYSTRMNQHGRVLGVLLQITPFLIIKQDLAREGMALLHSYKWQRSNSEVYIEA